MIRVFSVHLYDIITYECKWPQSLKWPKGLVTRHSCSVQCTLRYSRVHTTNTQYEHEFCRETPEVLLYKCQFLV